MGGGGGGWGEGGVYSTKGEMRAKEKEDEMRAKEKEDVEKAFAEMGEVLTDDEKARAEIGALEAAGYQDEPAGKSPDEQAGKSPDKQAKDPENSDEEDDTALQQALKIAVALDGDGEHEFVAVEEDPYMSGYND